MKLKLIIIFLLINLKFYSFITIQSSIDLSSNGIEIGIGTGQFYKNNLILGGYYRNIIDKSHVVHIEYTRLFDTMDERCFVGAGLKTGFYNYQYFTLRPHFKVLYLVSKKFYFNYDIALRGWFPELTLTACYNINIR